MNREPRGVRLDQWLWAARFFKTRALAKQGVETGKVEADGQRAKPARPVVIGDALVIERGGERFEIAVQALASVRGAPASRRPCTLNRKHRRPRANGRARSAPPSAPATGRRRRVPTSARGD